MARIQRTRQGRGLGFRQRRSALETGLSAPDRVQQCHPNLELSTMAVLYPVRKGLCAIRSLGHSWSYRGPVAPPGRTTIS